MPKCPVRENWQRLEPIFSAIPKHKVVRKRELAHFIATLSQHLEENGRKGRRSVPDLDVSPHTTDPESVLVVAPDHIRGIGQCMTPGWRDPSSPRVLAGVLLIGVPRGLLWIVRAVVDLDNDRFFVRNCRPVNIAHWSAIEGPGRERYLGRGVFVFSR